MPGTVHSVKPVPRSPQHGSKHCHHSHHSDPQKKNLPKSITGPLSNSVVSGGIGAVAHMPGHLVVSLTTSDLFKKAINPPPAQSFKCFSTLTLGAFLAHSGQSLSAQTLREQGVNDKLASGSSVLTHLTCESFARQVALQQLANKPFSLNGPSLLLQSVFFGGGVALTESLTESISDHVKSFFPQYDSSSTNQQLLTSGVTALGVGGAFASPISVSTYYLPKRFNLKEFANLVFQTQPTIPQRMRVAVQLFAFTLAGNVEKYLGDHLGFESCCGH